MKSSILKRVFRITTALFFTQFSVSAQEIDINVVYQSAMSAYDSKDYKEASNQFTALIDNVEFKIKNASVYYNGACIYALNNQPKKAFKLLEYLINEKLYSNYKHISTDSDLESLHTSNQWAEIMGKVKANLTTQPERNREMIKKRLIEAKSLLDNDNGKLWEENIWHTDFLILDFDNTIYTLKPIVGFKTTDSTLYYSKMNENELSFSNSVQEYMGKEYATILISYLTDDGSTFIHELFHTLQNKHITLNGEPIVYLDNYDARQWLRLEFKALKTTLQSIMNNQELEKIKLHFNDALLFRKIRQTKYKEHLTKELEIETLEGLAQYTGVKLSNTKSVYADAITEIDEREAAPTYGRPFPYATGLAYGLIFDYLNIEWKKGLDSSYNFLEIYEKKVIKKELAITDTLVLQAKSRNNFKQIHQEELAKKIEQEKLIDFYSEMFFKKPTLSVTSINNNYGRSYDMYGTLTLDSSSIVYSRIKGTAQSKENFGNFYIKEDIAKLGTTGILGTWVGGDVLKFTFPLPEKIEDNKIIGEFYVIELNEGWEVVKVNSKGNLEIVKKIE